MNRVTRVGVDLAKNLIQVHAVDTAGKVVVNRALKRDKFLLWCADLPAGCIVAMEACSGSHHWARKLEEMGMDTRIIAAQFVSPYRVQGKTGKNDANDAAAVCEATSRPHMNFVATKTIAQQGILSVHAFREGLKEDRTACTNRIRSILAEFGVVLPKSTEALAAKLSQVTEDASNDIAGVARLVLQRAQEQWKQLDEHIQWCDERIAAHGQDEQVRRAAELKGIGPVTASAVVATVGDFKQFKNGAQFAAWLGLTPRQNSSGGKTKLGGITKRGSAYLRTLLVQGAKAVVFRSMKAQDPISQWAQRLRERNGWQKAAVALANKNARILWAVMTKGEHFDPNHVSMPPGLVSHMAVAV